MPGWLRTPGAISKGVYLGLRSVLLHLSGFNEGQKLGVMVGCEKHRSGRVLREMAYLPLAEDIPILFNSCRQGPRSIDWRSDRDAEITWIEAQVRLLLGLSPHQILQRVVL